MIYFAGVAIAVAIILLKERRVPVRIVAALGVLLVGFALVGAAATVVRGRVPTAGGAVDYWARGALLQHDPSVTDEPEALRELLHERLPGEWVEELDVEAPQLGLKDNVRRYVHNLHAQIENVLPSTVDLGMWALVALGLFGAPWKGGRWKTELILASLWLFFFTAAPLVFFTAAPLAQLVHPRHLLPYLLIAICWAGAGAANFGRWYSRTTQDGEIVAGAVRKGAIIALVFAGLFQVKPDLDFIQAAFNGEIPTEEKAAGHWLREYGDPDDLVLERKTTVTFYAGLRGSETPYTSYDRVIEFARLKGARFIVVSSRNLMEYRPQLAPLLEDEPEWEPELKLVHEARNRHNADLFVRIFEVQEASTGSELP